MIRTRSIESSPLHRVRVTTDDVAAAGGGGDDATMAAAEGPLQLFV